LIPTPVGNCKPECAIAFKQAEMKHVYPIAAWPASHNSK
jgi:hypothetical protein